jgi:hypothetical protein
MTTEEKIKKTLEKDFGLTVEKIPECESKTPDYHAYNNKEHYIIEIKEKEDNQDIKKDLEKTLLSGNLYSFVHPIEPKSVIKKIIRDAKQQIDEYLENETTFRVIWLHCTSIDYSGIRELVLSGIYGSETLIYSNGEQSFYGLCYYFNESLFFKYKNKIDAVVISCRNGESQLCLNNYSPRYEDFKNSTLAKTFIEEAVIDPLLEEASGDAFIMDSSINRKNIEDVLACLKQKYNLDNINIMKIKHIEMFSISK